MLNYQMNFKEAILKMDRVKAHVLINELLKCSTPIQVIDSLISPVLEELGSGWEQGKLALSQIYMAGILCEELIETVLPQSTEQDCSETKIGICVLEDYHELGKRVVSSTIRANGFKIADYGCAVTVEDLVSWVRRDKIELLLISVLMLRSALKVKDLRAGLDRCGYSLKIAVGGAPFRLEPNLWREVGADVMGRNSADAIKIVREFAGEVTQIVGNEID